MTIKNFFQQIKTLQVESLNGYFVTGLLLTMLSYFVVFTIETHINFSGILHVGITVAHALKFVSGVVLEKAVKRGIKSLCLFGA